MSDLWFYEWIKMNVERWANCQNKEFAHRSKRSLSLKECAFWAVRSLSDVTMISFLGGFLDFFPMYCVLHCFICRPSDSTVSKDAGIELLPWQSEALTTRLDLFQRTKELLTKRMMKDVFILVSVTMYCIDVSEYETVSTYQCTIVSPIHIEMYWLVYVCMHWQPILL